MRIKSLSLKNFMSFENAEIQFPSSGVYFVEGKNYDEGGSNGAGKSALFEALVWLFYDRTIRDTSSVSAVRKGETECEVLAIIEKGDKEYLVCRRRGERKQLLLDDKEISQENLQNWIGISYDEFVNSVIFGQGIIKTFLFSTDTERKEILSKILGIEQYRRASELSREKRKELETKRTILEAELTQEKIILERINREINSLKQEISEKRKLLEELSGKTEEVDIEYLKSLEKKYEEIEKGIYNKEKAFSDVEKKEQKILSEIGILKGIVSDLEHKKTEIEKIKGNCPVCFRPLDSKSKKSAKEHIEKEIQKTKEKIKEKEKECEKIKGQIDIISNELEKMRKEQKTLAQEVTQNREKLNALMKERGRKEEIEKVICGVEEKIVDLEREKQGIIKKVSSIEEEIKKVGNEIEVYEFWEEGFGNRGIISMLIDPAIEVLEMRSNYYLSKISENIRVKISRKTALKTGEEREKLSIEVINPYGISDYKNSSGGEKKRLDLSLVLALRDLVMWKGIGTSFNLFVADEVFDSVDEQGASKICSILSEFADLVFVISHNEDLKKFFPMSIRVIKKGGVSFVEI